MPCRYIDWHPFFILVINHALCIKVACCKFLFPNFTSITFHHTLRKISDRAMPAQHGADCSFQPSLSDDRWSKLWKFAIILFLGWWWLWFSLEAGELPADVYQTEPCSCSPPPAQICTHLQNFDNSSLFYLFDQTLDFLAASDFRWRPSSSESKFMGQSILMFSITSGHKRRLPIC